MKIPTTPPGGAPYYGAPMNGMEMNPQWQGNGVMLEGGPPGNGGPYMMPHHVHPAGFVPPSGYYGPGGSPPHPPQPPLLSPSHPHQHQSSPAQDFSEYMWMENEEEFDKQVMQQLEEEALMEQCIEAMLADEREALNRGDMSLEEQVSKSTLNPLAAEFVPTFLPAASSGSNSDPFKPTVSNTSDATNEDSRRSPTEALSELSITKKDISPKDEPKTEPDTTSPADQTKPTVEDATKTDQESVKSTAAKVAEVATAAIVVVSAKDVLTPKSSLGEEKPSKKKTAEPIKRDAKKPESRDSVKKDKPTTKQQVTETKAAKTSEKVRTISGDKEKRTDKVKVASTERIQQVDKAKPAAVDKPKAHDVPPKEQIKKQEPIVKKEEVIVDLQGPPLPTVQVPVVSALASVAPEPEKPTTPAAPAVFNYAAAARANLPPKQPATTVPSVPSKESTPAPTVARTASAPSVAAAAKGDPSAPKESRSGPIKPRQAEKAGAKDDKRYSGKSATANKKGKK